MWLWRPRSPTVCHLPAGETGKLVTWFSLSLKACEFGVWLCKSPQSSFSCFAPSFWRSSSSSSFLRKSVCVGGIFFESFPDQWHVYSSFTPAWHNLWVGSHFPPSQLVTLMRSPKPAGSWPVRRTDFFSLDTYRTFLCPQCADISWLCSLCGSLFTPLPNAQWTLWNPKFESFSVQRFPWNILLMTSLHLLSVFLLSVIQIFRESPPLIFLWFLFCVLSFYVLVFLRKKHPHAMGWIMSPQKMWMS